MVLVVVCVWSAYPMTNIHRLNGNFEFDWQLQITIIFQLFPQRANARRPPVARSHGRSLHPQYHAFEVLGMSVRLAHSRCLHHSACDTVHLHLAATFFLGYFHFGSISMRFYSCADVVARRISCATQRPKQQLCHLYRASFEIIPTGTGCFATAKNSQFVINTH